MARSGGRLIRTHRRNYNNTPPWKGALAYGILTGVVFISFFLLYLLVKNLTATDEWKRFILGETDPAATAPNLPPAPVHDSTPPPAPAEATGSDPAE